MKPTPLKPAWRTYFAGLAAYVATKSDDNSRQCGAVIIGPGKEVRSTGFNGLPAGVEHAAGRYERPAKYAYTEHAERNAIYLAARHGASTDGCAMFVNQHPCADCARAIIQAGIRALYCPWPNMTHPRWGESFKAAKEMMIEAGVELNYMNASYFRLTADMGQEV
jgi:dCMP deaminase